MDWGYYGMPHTRWREMPLATQVSLFALLTLLASMLLVVLIVCLANFADGKPWAPPRWLVVGCLELIWILGGGSLLVFILCLALQILQGLGARLGIVELCVVVALTF